MTGKRGGRKEGREGVGNRGREGWGIRGRGGERDVLSTQCHKVT